MCEDLPPRTLARQSFSFSNVSYPDTAAPRGRKVEGDSSETALTCLLPQFHDPLRLGRRSAASLQKTTKAFYTARQKNDENGDFAAPLKENELARATSNSKRRDCTKGRSWRCFISFGWFNSSDLWVGYSPLLALIISARRTGGVGGSFSDMHRVRRMAILFSRDCIGWEGKGHGNFSKPAN